MVVGILNINIRVQILMWKLSQATSTKHVGGTTKQICGLFQPGKYNFMIDSISWYIIRN